MPKTANVSNLKELVHEYLSVVAKTRPNNSINISLREIRRSLMCSYKRLVIALQSLRAAGVIGYAEPKAQASTRLTITVIRPAHGIKSRVPESGPPDRVFANSHAISNLNGTFGGKKPASHTNLASELKASFFSNLQKNFDSSQSKNDENVNSKPVNNYTEQSLFNIHSNTNTIESTHHSDSVLGIEKKRKSPELHEIFDLENLLKKLYREIFRCSYWRLGSGQRDRTVAERIIENCKSQNWDLEDFLRIQFEWFNTVANRQPVISNLCGIKAMERYDNWLRQEGYQTRAADEALVTDVDQRNRDVWQMRYTRASLEHDERHGMLQSQFDAKLFKHIDKFTANLPESEIKRYAKLVCDDRPSWLVTSLTQADIRELAIRRAVVEEQERLKAIWRRRHEERNFYEDLIQIEKETGEPSPQLKGIDLEKAGVQNWLIEIHEAIVLKAQAPNGTVRHSVS